MIRMVSISTTTTRRYLVETKPHIGEKMNILTNTEGEMTSTHEARIIARQREPEVKLTTAIFPAEFDEIQRPLFKD